MDWVDFTRPIIVADSRGESNLSRRMVVLAGALVATIYPWPAMAQNAEPPERIDLTITQPSPRAEELQRQCEEKQQAASITGEIVVCARTGEDDAESAGWDKEEWENRYAAETRGRDPVDACGPNCGIFKGAPTVGSLCIPGLQKCPPPPALIIDVSALPQAPPGSDADRIARGLPPLGNDRAAPRPAPAQVRHQVQEDNALGLPPPPDFSDADAAGERPVSPAGSEAPAAPR